MKNKHFLKKIQTVILAAVIAFTSIPVNTSATEVTEINVEDVVNLPENSDYADNDLEVSANDLDSDENADSDLVTEDSFFGFKLNPVSKDELNREIEELKENASVPVIDLSETGENDIEADRSGDIYINSDYNISYPAKYDPRSLGLVTSVKNQGQWGLCWDYAAMSTAESSLIKTGLANYSVDLSELHSAYVAYKKYTYNNESFTSFCNDGGNWGLVYYAMNDGYGPVLESTVSWQEPTDDFTLSNNVFSSHAYELQKIYMLKYSADQESINKVKWLVSNYGAATISLYMYYTNGWGFKEAGSVNGDASFYFPQSINTTNHALSVVGWDDSYPATNFGVTAPGNGAWLVKNSYGSGDTRLGSGFMWVSYFDGSMYNDDMVAPVFVKNGTLSTSIDVRSDVTEIYAGESYKVKVDVVPAGSKGKILGNQADLYANTGEWFTVKTDAEYSEKGGYYTEDNAYRFDFEKENEHLITGSERFKTWSAPVKVKYLPIVTLPENTKSLKIGENYQLSPTVKGNIPDGFTESFSYVSSDPNVAYVNNKGKIIVKGYGSADITVTDKNGLAKEATFTVNGLYNYTDISTTTDSQIILILNKGESKSYAVPIFLESDGDVLEITGNKDAKIEKISGNDFGYVEDGKIVIDTLKDEYVNPNGDYTTNGSYEFKVSYKGVYTNNQTVSTSIKVNLKTIYPVISNPTKETTLKMGESYTLTPEIISGKYDDVEYVYTSDNSAVTVSKDGKITNNGYYGDVVVKITDKKKLAKPFTFNVKARYGYTDLSMDKDITITLTRDNSCGSYKLTPSIAGLKGDYKPDVYDYHYSLTGETDGIDLEYDLLSVSAYPLVNQMSDKTYSFKVTVSYNGKYTDYTDASVTANVTVKIADDLWETYHPAPTPDPDPVDPVNPTPAPMPSNDPWTPVPSDNPVIPNPFNGNGNGTNGNGNVTNPNPNNTTPSVKPVTVKKTTCSAKNSKGKLKITWKKKSGITGYQVQYSTNKKFKNAKTKTIKNARTVSKTYKAIKKGKKHYVRVRTYKIVNGRKYYSSWSKVKSVVVK